MVDDDLRAAGRARPTRCRACHVDDRRRPLDPGRPRHEVRPDPHRLHRHAQRELGRRLRAHRDQPLHGRGLRGVLRPPEAGRHPERVRGCTGSWVTRRCARRCWRSRRWSARASSDPRAATWWCCSAATSSASCSGPCWPAASRGPAAELARMRQLAAGARRRCRVRPRRPVPARMGGPARGRRDHERFCAGLPPRRVPADRRQAVLLQHDAGSRDIAAKPPPRATSTPIDPLEILARHARDPGGAVRARASCLPLALMPRGTRPPTALAPRSSRAIGLGFLLLEVVLIQRFVLFLGFPTYALSVVLFALLAFTGLGSLLSARGATPRRSADRRARAAVTVLIAAAAFGLQPLLARADRAAVRGRAWSLTVVAARPGRAGAGHGDADRADAARRPAPGRRALGVGGERHRLGARLGARGGDGDHVRASRS